MQTTFRSRVQRLLAHANSLRAANAARASRAQGTAQILRFPDGGLVRTRERAAMAQVLRGKQGAADEPTHAFPCGSATQSHRDRRASLRLVQGGRSEDRGRVSTGNRWRLAAVAVVAGCILSACGGGGGSSGSSAPQSSSGGLLGSIASTVSTPAQAAQAVNGNIYTSTDAWVTSLALTSGSPYNFQTVYSVTIPNVLPTDAITCNAQAEVTNDLGYNVQVDRAIAYGTVNGAYPSASQPITTENVTPDMHHMTINWTWIDTGNSGSVTYSLDLAAASTSAGSGASITVEQGYGYLRCSLVHASS